MITIMSKDITWITRSIVKRRIGQSLNNIAKVQSSLADARRLEMTIDKEYDKSLKAIMDKLEHIDNELAKYAQQRYGVSRETLNAYRGKGR